MVFHNHTEAWKAFSTLFAASKEGLAFLNPSWVRPSSYFVLGKKAKEAIEAEHNNKEILEVIGKLKDDALDHQPSTQPATPSVSL